MAGIVLALGDEITGDFTDIQNHFYILKTLKASYEFLNGSIHIIKYQRRRATEDYSWFESPEIVICVVGTIIFKDFGFEDSAREIGNALSIGIDISKIIDEIDGNYLLIIIDKMRKECLVITDAGGVINTYILENNGRYFISTSMLALAKTFPVSPDLRSILMFLRSGMFFNYDTYFNEIKILKPASIYRYDVKTRKLTDKKYWRVPKRVNYNISFEDAAYAISESLINIIDRIPTENAIYDFTGGYDSRFILALAYSREIEKKRINTFFFGPPGSREARIVEHNCKNIGITYNNYVLPDDWPIHYFDYILESHRLCDGMENVLTYGPVLWALKKKSDAFSFAVNGLFGELYRQRRWITEFGRRGKRCAPNLRRLIRYRDLTENFKDTMFSDEYIYMIKDIPNQIIEIYQRTNKIFDNKVPNTLKLDNIYFAQKARRWGGRNVLTANQLIQTVCPLWFRKPLEISLGLPPEYKKNNKLMRYIVEKEAPLLAKEKMISGAPFIQINFRNIYKFLPTFDFYSRIAIRKFYQVVFKKSIWQELTIPAYNTSEWYRRTLKDPRCQDSLNWGKMVSQGLYEKGGFEDFIKTANMNNFPFYGELGRILTLELTLRIARLKGSLF